MVMVAKLQQSAHRLMIAPAGGTADIRAPARRPVFWHNGRMPPTSYFKLSFLLFLAPILISKANAQENTTLPVGEQTAPRSAAPPSTVLCDRSQLTSYNGIVSDYSRTPEIVSITISTDWGTVESVVVNQADGEFERYFLMFSRTFSEEDWPLIESEPGELLPNVRATAWICLDGVTPPQIDWQPGYSKPGRSRRQP